MFKFLEKYHQIFFKENMKAAPDHSHFFFTRVDFLGNIFEGNRITSLESRLDAILKLQSL